MRCFPGTCSNKTALLAPFTEATMMSMQMFLATAICFCLGETEQKTMVSKEAERRSEIISGLGDEEELGETQGI